MVGNRCSKQETIEFHIEGLKKEGWRIPVPHSSNTFMRFMPNIVLSAVCRKRSFSLTLKQAYSGLQDWQDVIWALIENNAAKSGVMMHLVTPELDRGPVITHCTFPIRGEHFDKHWREIDGHPVAEIKKQQGENNALFKLIRQHGLAREFPLIVSTLRAFSRSEVKIEAGAIFDRYGKPISGYDLTDEVDRAAELR